MRLRPHELSAAVTGELELIDHEGASTFRRVIRVANLWAETHSGSRRTLLVPLWDPHIVRIGADWFTLQGIELGTQDNRVAEHLQMWRCNTFGCEL